MRKLYALLFICLGSFSFLQAETLENDKPEVRLQVDFYDVKTGEVLEVLNFTENSIENVDLVAIAQSLNKELNNDPEDCMVTYSVTVSVSIEVGGSIGIAEGNVTTEVSVTASFTSTCDKIIDTIKGFIKDVREMAGV